MLCKKVPLGASLLIVLNEIGQILAFKVVPSDTRSFLQEMLKEIWTTPDLSVKCDAIYTDNPKVDKNAILTTYHSTFPDQIDTLDVCLDIFHAKNRVVKELQRSHPDYRAAVSELGKIFGKVINRGFDFKEDLAKAFQDFADTFSKPTTKLSKNKKLVYMGITF
jgi:hypothetical protein